MHSVCADKQQQQQQQQILLFEEIVYRINTIPQVAEANRGGKWRISAAKVPRISAAKVPNKRHVITNFNNT